MHELVHKTLAELKYIGQIGLVETELKSFVFFTLKKKKFVCFFEKLKSGYDLAIFHYHFPELFQSCYFGVNTQLKLHETWRTQ